MAINKVDYDVLASAVKVYHAQAEALAEVLSTLTTMNDQLQDGWTNQTATAFVERFGVEHGPAIQNASEAIESISVFIQNYMDNKQADDEQGAAAVRG